MLRDALTLSALIAALLLVRAMFKNRVPKRMVYALWLAVLLKLCLPGTLFSLPVLPAEDAAASTQSAELTAQAVAAAQQPAQTTPVIQQPPQTVTQPQTPAQQPVSPVQEAVKPAAKTLTAAQIFQIVWFSGSALIGLWLFGAWVVFTIRLRRDRCFLCKRGGTRIYVSGAVKSPCLAGLIPAVYLTEDVLQTDEAELILRHELTHLRHLDHLWSFCRAAAVTVYWWNPLVWIAAICSKRDAELACDEAVAAKLPEKERLAYARAILAQAPRKTAALSLAGPPVKERILFLTKKQRTSVLCVILALLLVVSATGCSFAELTRQRSGEITLPDHSADPSSEAAPQEVDSALPVMDTVELIGYVADSQTPWIELYESTDSKEPLAEVPYDLIAALPGCDRKSEAFTFGYLDSITFYYGEIGAFCWCVAALPPAAGTGAANVCTSPDSGETWSISDPNALYTGTVIGAGFASETVGFISYRYFFDNGPEIARTLDGGKTWARLELDIPEEYAQYNMQPQTPTFSGNDGSYPVILLDKDGNDRAVTLQTHDGGMTWTWPESSNNTAQPSMSAADWLTFADTWRLDYLPDFSRGAAPASTSSYLMWVFSRNMDALKEQGYMTKSYVETEIRVHFEVEALTHEGLTKTWDFDGEAYTAIPGGVKDRPLARLDGITTAEENGRLVYNVQYTLVQPNHLVLSDRERQALEEQLARGDSTDLQELGSYTVCFTYENGEPVFLSHTERSPEETLHTITWSWAPYDTLYRTDGTRMGLVREADGTRHIGEVPDTKVWIRLKDGTLLSDEPFDACIDYMGEPEGEVYCIRNGTGYCYTVSAGDGSFRLSEVDEPKTLEEDHFGYRLRVYRWDSREPCYGIVTADGAEVIAPVYERVEIPFPDRFLLYEGGASQGPVMGRCRLTDENGSTLSARFHWIDYSVFDDGYIGIAVCYGERAAYPCYDEDGQPMPEGYWLVDRDGNLLSERYAKLSFGDGDETHAASEDDVLHALREDGTETLLPVAELLRP